MSSIIPFLSPTFLVHNFSGLRLTSHWQPSTDMALDSPLDGYTVNGTLTWIGTIEEGGPEYTFRGTAQVISNQIREEIPLRPILTVLSRSCLRFSKSTPITMPTRLLL